ncbi:MAG: flavin reductase family protein [Neisseriaceae bacterium]|nr:flavin reductase family protein [Neisseriaceae bacterium]MBP6861444.1 flavin reductase family protein [Neisseriaceae bacterium]
MPSPDAHSFLVSEADPHAIYKLMVGAVTPRPIAWVSSVSATGVLNLAPFSFFTVASRNPPTLMVSIGPGVEARTGTVKDTLANIRATKEYVINIAGASLVSALATSGASVAAEVDEFVLAGLTPEPSRQVGVPSVQEAPVAFEMVLDQIINVGTDHVILGRVVNVRVEEAVYAGNHKIDVAALAPLASVADRFSGITPMYVANGGDSV